MSTHIQPHESTDRSDYVVPEDVDTYVCAYCEAPFADAEFRALHWGLAHREHLSETERAAFEDAYEAESDEIRLFRLKALIVLVSLYFGLLITYAVIT